MHPGDMCGVQQVVGHVQVVARDNHTVAAIETPRGVTPFRHVTNFRFVCQFDITHPDPDQTVAHGEGVAANLGALGNALTTGRPDAATRAVEGQTVVTTFNVITFATAH